MRVFPILLTFIFFHLSLFSQQISSNPWNFISETNITAIESERQIVPLKYQTAEVDLPQLEGILKQAPLWFSEAAKDTEVVLTLPMPDGTVEKFTINYAPVMHPDLAAKYPMIRSYAGQGIDDPTAYLRFDLTQKGFHAMIRSGYHSTVFIDPYAKGNTKNYVVYYKKDFQKKGGAVFECGFDEVNDKIITPPPPLAEFAGDCQLRTYRFAMACTGEYGQFHGGTTADALAAINTTLTRISGIYETDINVHFELIPNNDQIVYLNGATDPYNNTNACSMIGENISNVNAVIGTANFDVGHVVATGGSGCAQLAVICSTNKAGGATGLPNPVGDPFDVDYVAHEVGHQFGGNHTQNNSCNRNNATAMEPGSASTIMGYAGICAPNVQNNSDDHFHAISIQEMQSHISGSGGNCPVVTDINDTPTAAAGINQTIPASTPFMLVGIGTDPDGDTLTYCWEQMDNQVATMPPQSTNTGGPMFRSISPHVSPTRYMPNLPDLVNNVSPTWEVLSSVSRTLNFRLTVRDNNFGGGCTAEDDIVVTVDGASGPFIVTAPNTPVVWPALSQQTITWNVAGTNTAPVNAPDVDIFLSLDGGFTYPITLATATPNDGSHTITVPDNQTTTARVMVQGSGNIFFDISDENFTIDPPLNDFTLEVTPVNQVVCAPNTTTYTATIEATGSFSGNVTLSTVNLPVGLGANFSNNPVSVPPLATSTLTISNTGAIAGGNYSFDVIATGSTGTKTETVNLVISSGVPSATTLLTPTNAATGISVSPTFTWSGTSMAASYDFELADDANFANILESQTSIFNTLYTSGIILNTNSTYYWRVRATNACGTGSWSSTWSFTTENIVCNTFMSSDVPVNIPSNGTPTVTSTLTINNSGLIDDVNVLDLNINHTWVEDLVISVTSPQGTTVTILSEPCGQQNNVDINFDDESTNPYGSFPCPPTNGGTYQPFQALSAFNGEDLNGTWIMTIQDVANQDGGTLNSWGLEICYQPIVANPLTVTILSTDIDCNGNTNGTATAIAVGGVPGYSYLWSNGAMTGSIAALGAGTYSVTVTDSNNSTAVASVTLTEPPVLLASINNTATTCNLQNGTATVTAGGGTPPYTYAWNTGETSASISNLVANTYSVTVTDANGCIEVASTVVATSNALSLAINSANANCNGESSGTATAIPSNGSGSYSYLWSNGVITATVSNIPAGIYTVDVTDNISGCTATESITITEPSALTVSVSETSTVCGLQNGTAMVTVSGGTGGHTYLWSNGATTSSIINLAAGTYTVEVADANGCTTNETAIIASSNTLTISMSQTNITCHGDDDGTASATPSNGSGSYSYSWNNGATTANLSNLTAGTYAVEVTDDVYGCTATNFVTILEPTELSVTISPTHTTCGLQNGGTAAVVSGGTPPYSYLWNNGANTASLGSLPAGSYEVTVTDANGCTATTSEIIISSIELSITSSHTNLTCHGNMNGTASTMVLAGSGNYSYLWSNGETTANLSNLAAGTYTVEVTDDLTGCIASESVTLTEPPALIVTLTPMNTFCGFNNGEVSANVSGGTPGYTYLWSNGATGTTISSLAPGNYSVEVTDNQGCTTTTSTTVTASTSLNIFTFPTHVDCPGGMDGEVFAFPSGGSGNYTYLWNNGATTATISNLTAGNYTVEITDTSNGCTGSASVDIDEPDPIAISFANTNATCGNNNGAIIATASGGTPSYIYIWNTGNFGNSLGNLGSGMYEVSITDSKGCSSTASTVITASTSISASINSTNVLCNGENTGTAEVLPSGGTPPYSYAWNNGQNSATIIGLTAGTYLVTITDIDGCTATAATNVTEPTTLVINTVSTNLLCFEDNSGAISTSVFGGTPPYMYMWGGGQTTAVISNLIAGNYDVTITDANGCTNSTSVVITEPSILELSATTSNVLCNGGSDGSASASGLGGMPPYTYSWNNGQTTVSATNLIAGNYDVTITDANGCTNSTSVVITEPSILELSATASNVLCNGGSDGSASASGLGGTPPYTYSWNNGQTTVSATNLIAGNYDVTITDANGCTNSTSVVITEPSILEISATASNVLCNGGSDGSASASGLGGMPPYTYSWNNGQTTVSATNLIAGNYDVTITDANGCTNSTSVVITEPTALNLIVTMTNTTCGSNNGTTTTTISGGTPNYSYLWSNGQTGSSLSNLAAGNYSVEVMDANGCTQSTSLTIAPSSNTPTMFTTPAGTFEDGSGINDYVNSTECEWLIQPDNAISITLDFTAFDTESGFDFVRVYDGATSAEPLLGEYSGNTLPPSITSTGGSLFVQFSTNTSIIADGWDASYVAEICVLDLSVNDNPIPGILYTAGNSITSEGRVANGTTVTFSAGDQILMENEFEVELGATFEAIIEGCLPAPLKDDDEE